ncbi:MAG: nickel-dependent hydrogenase large subunit, partial [Bryobacteraceae bacterium]|nr:nickel-dependent hydrogenase large subunit [Bryobacteraceae bacterium]
MSTVASEATKAYRRVSVDPITRLEGHGKIDIFLDQEGEVAECYFQVPELRGFEKFCEGRPVEEMPRITPRICGVCPEAHLMASAKACDAVYKAELPLTARLLRELQYNIFYVTDHATHFYALAAPDFVLGPTSDPATRNLLGLVAKVGPAIAGQVLQCRAWGHEAAAIFGGKPVNPVNAIPGGMSKGINAEERARLEEICRFMVEFGKFTLKLFHDVVLSNKEYVDLILNGPYLHRTYSMGLVDEKNRVNYYDGWVRVVDPDGKELCRYAPHEYTQHVAERVEPWSYLKFPYLKAVGWKGFVDGKDSGVYRATPQSRPVTSFTPCRWFSLDFIRRRPELQSTFGNFQTEVGPDDMKRIFFSTDIHGSDVCFRKFLSCAKHLQADALILGGDLTGKMVVPIVYDETSGMYT